MSANDASLSLGEFLRQEREKRGITIEQVASATKIGVKTLHALEGDQYAELPAKPFVRGFVTSYCRFIGLDPKETLTGFGSFIDAKAHDRPNRDAGHSGYAFDKRDGDQSRTVLWAVMGSFVLLGGLAAVFVKKPLGGSHHGSHADKLRAAYGVSASPIPGMVSPSPEPAVSPSVSSSPFPSASGEPAAATPSPVPVPAASVPAPATPVAGWPQAQPSQLPPVPSATSEPISQPSSTPASDQEEGPNPLDPLNSGLKLKTSEIKYKVIFKAIDSAWVRYKVDHKPVTQFVFRTGKTLVLRAKESIRFQVAPPKSVTFSYLGSGFKPVLGDRHLVTRQNDATLIFPFELAESIEEPFPQEKPLSDRSVPAPRPTPSFTPSNP